MSNIPEHIHAFPRINPDVTLPMAVAAWDEKNSVLYIGDGETKGGVPFRTLFDEGRRQRVTKLDGENQIYITNDLVPVFIKTHLDTFYSIRGEDLSLNFDETKIIIDIKNVLAVNNLQEFIEDEWAWTVYFAKGEYGEKGDKGKDGITPEIGTDGYWYIGENKTEVKAKGEKGEDGITPEIGTDGYWYVGGTKTTVQAQGEKGEDGKTPVITIGDDGNWIIDGKDTGKTSVGKDGDKGEKGDKGENGKDGKTPVKGTDFLTETDMENIYKDITSYVDEKFLNGEW